jgi:hypothetical protein
MRGSVFLVSFSCVVPYCSANISQCLSDCLSLLLRYHCSRHHSVCLCCRTYCSFYFVGKYELLSVQGGYPLGTNVPGGYPPWAREQAGGVPPGHEICSLSRGHPVYELLSVYKGVYPRYDKGWVMVVGGGRGCVVCVCMRAYVRACVRACVCVRACAYVCH